MIEKNLKDELVHGTLTFKRLHMFTSMEFDFTSHDYGWGKEIVDEIDDLESQLPNESFFHFQGCLEKFESGLVFRGEIQGKKRESCVRCLTEFEHEFSFPVAAYFLPEQFMNPDDEGDAMTISGEEYEIYPMVEGVLDCRSFIYEQLLLNMPHFPLHDENCLGLCHHCGGDLNLGLCAH